MKRSLDSSIVSPLTELAIRTEMRRKLLVDVHNNNVENVKRLKQIVDKLRAATRASTEKQRTVAENNKAIGERAALSLKTARELCKSLTQAEEEFFSQVRAIALEVRPIVNQIAHTAKRP